MTNIDKELAILISSVPNGKFWEAKNIENTELRKFLRVFALANLETINRVDSLSKQLDIWSATEETISYWEKLVGLPDSIFTFIPTNLQDRINLVVLKLFGFKIVKKTDFINLLEKLFPMLIGSGWYIQTGLDNITLPYTLPFVLCSNKSHQANKFYINVPNSINADVLPYTLPFILAENIGEKIKKVAEYLVPFTKTVYVKYF
jgi:hypothetical protein